MHELLFNICFIQVDFVASAEALEILAGEEYSGEKSSVVVATSTEIGDKDNVVVATSTKKGDKDNLATSTGKRLLSENFLDLVSEVCKRSGLCRIVLNS